MSGPADLLRGREGQALILVLLVVTLLSTLALSLTTLTLSASRVESGELAFDAAAYLARAGFERACAEFLLGSNDWATLPTTAYTDAAFGAGSFDASFDQRSTDRVVVDVSARQGDTQRRIRFVALRRSDSGGQTVGVTLDAVEDLGLEQRADGA